MSPTPLPTTPVAPDVAALTASSTPSSPSSDAAPAAEQSTTPPADDADTAKEKLRWGKWTREEEAYTTRLIADFSAGLLTDVTNGTTMRSWLSAKLRCCPMRISKKFVGEQSIGKRMFERNEGRLADMGDDEKTRRAAEVAKLYDDFCESWLREEKERLETKTNGSRKRKRSKRPKQPSDGPAAKKPHPAAKHFPSGHAMFKAPAPTSCMAGLSPLLHRPTAMLFKAPPARPSPFAKSTTTVGLKKAKDFKPALTITTTAPKAVKPPGLATTPRPPVKRVNSVPHMTKPTQAPSLTPTKKTATASTHEIQMHLASRSKSLSIDLADPFCKDGSSFGDYPFELEGREFRDLDFDTDAWLPDGLGDYDPFGLVDSDMHAPLKEEELLDAALSPTSVMDLYQTDYMWSPMAFAESPVAASDVFLPPLYDCLL